jgi:RhoGEF domain
VGVLTSTPHLTAWICVVVGVNVVYLLSIGVHTHVHVSNFACVNVGVGVNVCVCVNNEHPCVSSQLTVCACVCTLFCIENESIAVALSLSRVVIEARPLRARGATLSRVCDLEYMQVASKRRGNGCARPADPEAASSSTATTTTTASLEGERDHPARESVQQATAPDASSCGAGVRASDQQLPAEHVTRDQKRVAQEREPSSSAGERKRNSGNRSGGKKRDDSGLTSRNSKHSSRSSHSDRKSKGGSKAKSTRRKSKSGRRRRGAQGGSSTCTSALSLSKSDGDLLKSAQATPVTSLSSDELCESATATVAAREEEEKRVRLRAQALEEVIASERAYLVDLHVIVAVFKEPLQAEKLLEPSDIVDVFSNVSVLITINKELLTDLEKERHRSRVEQRRMKVAPTFLQLADFLKMYSVYCNNQAHAFATVEALQRRSKRFREFLETAMSVPQTKGLSLLSFLIKPVQRICKYPLLIRQLLEHTPASHPDRLGLEEAQRKIQECVESINESKRAAENVRRIVDCQNRLHEGERLSLLTGSRRFVGVLECCCVGSVKWCRWRCVGVLRLCPFRWLCGVLPALAASPTRNLLAVLLLDCVLAALLALYACILLTPFHWWWWLCSHARARARSLSLSIYVYLSQSMYP